MTTDHTTHPNVTALTVRKMVDGDGEFVDFYGLQPTLDDGTVCQVDTTVVYGSVDDAKDGAVVRWPQADVDVQLPISFAELRARMAAK